MTRDFINLLSAIQSSGHLEIRDSEEPDFHTARVIEEAINDKLIRDRSSGWNASSIYVLTAKGVEAIGAR